MKQLYLFASLIISLSVPSQNLNAQDSLAGNNNLPKVKFVDTSTSKNIEDSSEYLFPRKSHFMASLTYLNNNVYLGRKDSVATPYITPMFGYYHKSGLYINGSVSYLAIANESRIDLITAEAGYNIRAGNFEGQASAAKYWYNASSFNVKSEIKGSLAFFAGYDFGFIKPTLTPALYFGEKMDISLTMGIEHSFYFDDDDIEITPAINVNASTENFYSSYYELRRYSEKRKKRSTSVNETISGTLPNAGQFQILDYELTAPISYTLNKFTLNFSPVYAIPVNPAIISLSTKIGNEAPKTTNSLEAVSNSFFFQLGITYKFSIKVKKQTINNI
jgi:hypothetical protein